MRPFRVDLGDDVLAGIQERLRSATLPQPRGEGWEHGAAIEYLEQFRRYWIDEFDWTAAQERSGSDRTTRWFPPPAVTCRAA